MIIGRVVLSSSHVDYVCRIFDQPDVLTPPTPEDYPFAAFVQLGDAVGIIYRSELVNPDYSQQGPRLAVSESLRAVITPDLINERATLVGIFLIGESVGGHARQGIPKLVVPVHSEVRALSDAEVLAFHQAESGKLQLAYYPLLLRQTAAIGPALLMAVLDRLQTLVGPEEQAVLAVLRTTISWQATLV